ncbi:MAG TPA: DNA-binding response regulator [Acetobacteraceae bacterium]|jgi:DNA-binding NarL/FixJ family response regulator|nr:DNA-binding response regulator [Acetobacteraceae bacterium]
MPAFPEQRAPTVLIVDDSPGTLGFLTDALERERFTVLVALRGERALATVQQMRPDLVLMDAVMPDLDGFETCRRLKRMPGAEIIPVIFMTGLSDTDHVIRGLEAGGVDYVTKPVVPQELVARIRVHLAGAQLVASAHAAIDAAGHALFAAGSDGKLRWATPGAARLLAGVLEPDGATLPPLLRALLGEQGSREMVELPILAEGSGDASVDIRLVGRIGPGETLLRIAASQPSQEEARLRARLPVTPREAEVLIWLTRGKSNRDIGEILGLSPRTVNKHLEQIYAKLGIENRSSAVAMTLHALAT